MTILGNCFPPKNSSQKSFFRDILENSFLQSFLNPFFGQIFLQTYYHIWVEFYVRIFFGRLFLGRFFHQIFFLGGVFFENCFVEISLQGVCGRNVFANTFLVEVSVGICFA